MGNLYMHQKFSLCVSREKMKKTFTIRRKARDNQHSKVVWFLPGA
ncbi:Uncharacterized protein EbC_30350 [Erwinia billingiae Eb661]|uniref:Uncharacterized protein n=1 Tax=Erwinia billingiae (strain Eb661) TaxID=634500 RepID=D8MUQ9_ERWBE|nr:Uncharacterized protein EbC_30350 [Erwinia billingiae Eb661]